MTYSAHAFLKRCNPARFYGVCVTARTTGRGNDTGWARLQTNWGLIFATVQITAETAHPHPIYSTCTPSSFLFLALWRCGCVCVRSRQLTDNNAIQGYLADAAQGPLRRKCLSFGGKNVTAGVEFQYECFSCAPMLCCVYT